MGSHSTDSGLTNAGRELTTHIPVQMDPKGVRVADYVHCGVFSCGVGGWRAGGVVWASVGEEDGVQGGRESCGAGQVRV